MRAYATKYATTKGVEEVEGEINRGFFGDDYFRSTDNRFFRKGEYFFKKEQAEDDVKNRIEKKIISLKAQINKLQKKIAVGVMFLFLTLSAHSQDSTRAIFHVNDATGKRTHFAPGWKIKTGKAGADSVRFVRQNGVAIRREDVIKVISVMP